jgi:hypothetical protein
MTARVPKRIDFVKERKAQGRALSAAVRKIAGLIQSIAQRNGIDLQAQLNEASARKSEERRLLAERLQESVVPLFVGDSGGQPERIGSCVLVRLDSDLFAFTAAHVIREADSARLFAPAEGRGGKLLPLPPCAAYLSPPGSHNDLDVGVLILSARQLGPFQQRVFLAGTEIDQNDRPDDQGLTSFYFVLGYSASRTQVKISKTERHIHQRSFHCSTNAVDAAEYLQEGEAQTDHLLLDFDHKEISVGGRRVNPPKLQGVSGGGIFHISRETKQISLVAIATRNRLKSRLILGTRIKHFLTMVRELKTKPKRSESK